MEKTRKENRGKQLWDAYRVPFLSAFLFGLLAYGFLLIYRLIDTRRYVKLHITAAILIPVAVMALAAIPYYASRWMMVDVASMVVAVAVIGLSFVIYSRKHHDKGEQTA